MKKCALLSSLLNGYRAKTIAATGAGLLIFCAVVLGMFAIRNNQKYVIQLHIPKGFVGRILVNIPSTAPHRTLGTFSFKHPIRVPVVFPDQHAVDELVGNWPDAEFTDTSTVSEAIEPDGLVLSQAVNDPVHSPDDRAIWIMQMEPYRGGLVEYFVGNDYDFKAFRTARLKKPYLDQFVPIVPDDK